LARDRVALRPSRRISPAPAVRVNRAFALGKAKGPSEGLLLRFQSDIDVNTYPYVHLVRGLAMLDEFASHWLGARLPEFRTQSPAIEVELGVGIPPLDLSRGPV
jgi:hypothetical protein